MAHYFHYIKPEAAPVKDLARLLNHLWPDELEDYAAAPDPHHVFHHLVAIANWLNAGTMWTADEYVAAREEAPDAGWLAARSASDAKLLNAIPEVTAEPAHWELGETGAPHVLRSEKRQVTVVVGWNAELSTYFAQVWDVPEGVSDYTEGRLLLWVGTDWGEVDTVRELGELVAGYVRIPRNLRTQLISDRAEAELPCVW